MVNALFELAEQVEFFVQSVIANNASKTYGTTNFAINSCPVSMVNQSNSKLTDDNPRKNEGMAHKYNEICQQFLAKMNQTNAFLQKTKPPISNDVPNKDKELGNKYIEICQQFLTKMEETNSLLKSTTRPILSREIYARIVSNLDYYDLANLTPKMYWRPDLQEQARYELEKLSNPMWLENQLQADFTGDWDDEFPTFKDRRRVGNRWSFLGPQYDRCINLRPLIPVPMLDKFFGISIRILRIVQPPSHRYGYFCIGFSILEKPQYICNVPICQEKGYVFLTTDGRFSRRIQKMNNSQLVFGKDDTIAISINPLKQIAKIVKNGILIGQILDCPRRTYPCLTIYERNANEHGTVFETNFFVNSE